MLQVTLGRSLLRPKAVSTWINGGRKLQKTPLVDREGLYAEFRGWYVDLCKARGKKLPLSRKPADLDHAPFKGGKNGIYMLVLALSWCNPGQSTKMKRDYRTLCEDVAWMFSELGSAATSVVADNDETVAGTKRKAKEASPSSAK